MDLFVNKSIQLKPIDAENATLLFPLFKADLKEICQWFPFDEDYKLEYDLSYADEKKPPYDETYVIYYNGEPCGRVGLYDYDQSKGEIYLYYWVASPFRRKHIAIDSVLAVMDYLKSLGMKSVLFDVKKGNEYSIELINHLPNVELLKDEANVLIYLCSIQQLNTKSAALFLCQDMLVSNDGNRIVAHLINELGARSLDIFDFKDNLIYREYEFILD